MKVKFIPQNVEFEIKPGQSVMHVAQDHNLYVKSVCKGVPSCAECRVRVVDGDHNVLPPGSEELSLIGTGHFIDRRRLSCQLKCFGDITVDMSEQLAKQQGLVMGQKKKKLAIKDDRVEDSHAIRASTTHGDEEGEGESAESGGRREGRQQQQRQQRGERGSNRGGGQGEKRGDQNRGQGKQGGGGGQRNQQQQERGEQRQASQGSRREGSPRPPSAEGKMLDANGAPDQAAAGDEAGDKKSGRRRRRRGGRGGGGDRGGSRPPGGNGGGGGNGNA